MGVDDDGLARSLPSRLHSLSRAPRTWPWAATGRETESGERRRCGDAGRVVSSGEYERGGSGLSRARTLLRTRTLMQSAGSLT